MGGNANGGVQYEHATRRLHSSKLQHRAPSKAPIGLAGALATLGKPLIREFLFNPRPASLEAGGQWPVCCAGASPTEVRCGLHLQCHILFHCQRLTRPCQVQIARIS